MHGFRCDVAEHLYEHLPPQSVAIQPFKSIYDHLLPDPHKNTPTTKERDREGSWFLPLGRSFAWP